MSSAAVLTYHQYGWDCINILCESITECCMGLKCDTACCVVCFAYIEGCTVHACMAIFLLKILLHSYFNPYSFLCASPEQKCMHRDEDKSVRDLHPLDC